MQQLQPEQAQFLFQTAFLPALQNEHGLTKNIIKAIPLDTSDYRPDEVSRTALDLAWHIATIEMMFMAAVSAAEFSGPPPRPDSIRNSADLADWYATNFQSHLDQLTKLSGDQLIKMINFHGRYNLPAVMYFGFMLHHSVHHRGQLSMYLRPMGAKVPAIYGESYDSAKDRSGALQNA